MHFRQISICNKVYSAYPITGALLCVLLCVLLALSVAASATPSAPATDVRIANNMTLELNDSTVNDSIALYPFFVLDVYKPLCNPCQRMKVAINELSIELDSQVAFGILDGRDNQMTESRYNISQYPTLLIFKNRTLVDRKEGFASKRYVVDGLRLMKPGLNTSSVSYK